LGCLPLADPSDVLFRSKNRGLTWDTLLVLSNVNYNVKTFEVLDSLKIALFTYAGDT
jgi:hypothetical protein